MTWTDAKLELEESMKTESRAQLIPPGDNVSFQLGSDGLWAHFRAKDQYFSFNLSIHRMSRPFADAYIKQLKQSGLE